MPIKDLTGKSFGKLIILKSVGKNKNGKTLWLCACNCGNQHITSSQILISGKCRSCGCIKSPAILEYQEILRKKIISNSTRDGSCLIWNGPYRKNFPHGIICCLYKGKKGSYQAHRISYSVFVEEIPENLFVLHKCDRPECVEPSHLHLGTQKDNIREMRERNRANDHLKGKKGIDHHNCKLSYEEILEIIKMKEDGMIYSEISKHFQVSQEQISNICRNKSWKHIQKQGF